MIKRILVKKFSIYFFGLVLLASCREKEKINNSTIQYKGSIPFIYNGKLVTYNIIEKTYYKDELGEPLDFPVTKFWLDRNLGAERPAKFVNDKLAAGDLFQWGRSDDGHQFRKSDTTREISDTKNPGHNKFIARPLGYNWLSQPDNALWNEPGNANCPCPRGWRLPTINELLMEMRSWESIGSKGAFKSDLKWAFTGNRDNHGTERYSDHWAFIWSSTVYSNDKAMYLAIIDTNKVDFSSSPKIYGLAVRCIRDK